MERDFTLLEVQGIDVRRVLSMKGKEALSTLFRYEIEVEVELPLPDVDAVIGGEARLTLVDKAYRERVVTGVVAEATAEAMDNERGKVHVVLMPMLWRQSLGRDCYASQDVTVQDVVDDVLADYTGKYRWDLSRSYTRYPYRAQYREDDITYVSRLLEEEGIYYWFDHDGGSVAVFSDTSANAPDMPGGAVLPWVRESALMPEQDAVTQLGSTSATTTGRFMQKSFDLRRPTVPIQAKAGEGKHEFYDAPGGGTAMEAIIATRVNDQRDATLAGRAGVAGLATSIRPYPGCVLQVIGHPSLNLNARFLVTGVEVKGDSHNPCHTRFTGIREEVNFRPMRVTPEAKQAGLQLGKVVGPDGQEVHPDDLARVRVILHWDRLGPHNEKGGTWMRVAQRGAPGSMLFPRMGWNVATFNEEGGVDAPSVIWRIHDGERPPEYKLPMNMTRTVWKTATVPCDGTANEIYFEDKDSAQEMFINASRDMNYKVLDAQYHTVNNNHTRTVSGNHDLTIKITLDERVIQDQTITIGGDKSLTCEGGRNKSVGGNETETVGGNRSLETNEAHQSRVNKSRTLIVGGNVIEQSENNINCRSKDSTVIIGGSVVKIAGEDMAEVCRKDSKQEIGGAKIEVAKKDRQLDVKKEWKETYESSVYLLTMGKYIDNADTTETWTVTASVDASAPIGHIQAVERIRFKCGNSELTIDKENIKLTAQSIKMTGDYIDADSAAIEHNP